MQLELMIFDIKSFQLVFRLKSLIIDFIGPYPDQKCRRKIKCLSEQNIEMIMESNIKQDGIGSGHL